MSIVTQERELPEEIGPTDNARLQRSRHFGWPLLTICTIIVLSMFPLLRATNFYYWDDSAAQFLPTWYHFGELIRTGHWPVLLELDAWMGGNYAAEALFGIYNPLYIANFVLVSLLPNIAIAAFIVKLEFMLILGMGVYVLAREYGAARWAASVSAVALPFSGFALYFDTAAWASGLMSFAAVPWVWWSARRSAQQRLNPLWAFLIGALTILGGNPYGALAVCIVFAAVIGESLARKRSREALRSCLVGLCIGAIGPVVYLPLVGNSSVTWRFDQGISNDGMLAPGLGDILNLSAPTYLPLIANWQPTLYTPAAYFVWFALPLAAWIRWDILRRRWRELTGLYIATVGFLAFTLSPSELWMFRWPLRVIECVYLGLSIIFAILLSGGLKKTYVYQRAAISVIVVFFSSYLAWAAAPQRIAWHLSALALVGGLTALAVWVWRTSEQRFALVLHIGIAAVLLLQTNAFVGNANLNNYRFPHHVAALKENFADYKGTTIQFAELGIAKQRFGLYPDGAWQDILFGSAYRPAEVRSVNAYTGMAFRDFSDTFCFNYIGESCPEGYQNLWKPQDGQGTTLADMMRVDTVVAQKGLINDVQPQPGWHVQKDNAAVTVLARNEPHSWPDGRLGSATPGLNITFDKSETDTKEVLRFERTGEQPAQLTFARLNWPGYSARVNGRDRPIRTGPAGLIVVDIPQDAPGGELVLVWQPPSYRTGLVFAGLGLLGALALGITTRRNKSRLARSTKLFDGVR